MDISSDFSDYFVMTNVKFTDMSNNPVEATINVNTFQFTSDENDFIILESMDDVGGRVRTDQVNGYLLDRGSFC